jgi:hypothetical protein
MSSATSILKLQSVGFTQDQVEALATLVDERAATKDDIREEIGKVREDVHSLEMRLTIRMAVMLSAFAGLMLGGIGLMLKFTLH